MMIYKDAQQEIYYVYLLVCSDNSFYVGLANDLIRRFEDHENGIYPTCYTYKRRPLQLKYYETIPFLQEAMDREKQIKGWSRSKKLTLINQDYHKLHLLAECNNLTHYRYKDLR